MSDPNGAIIIVGGGLSGLVAALELTKHKIPVTLVDQENEANLGGQAYWSLGGIFCVNSSEQRSQGIRDNFTLALTDWLNTAQFDREREDYWPRQWAKAFVKFAEGGMERYVKNRGLRFTTVGWAERGGASAAGHGNSVPRFHLTWGTGPEVVRIFEEPVRIAAKQGLVTFKFRHQVDKVIVDEKTGAAVGVSGSILEPSDHTVRGVATSRKIVDRFEIRGKAVIIASGGIGGNLDAVRKNWPLDRLGPAVPKSFVIGVPAHVDGKMVEIAESAGANTVNMDRMWHYTEGLSNWSPIWPLHGIRVIPGPSSMWLDAFGNRLPEFLFPGGDTLATLKRIVSTGYDYSWFILNREIISREFALSGSEQNGDITRKSYVQLFTRLFGSQGTPEVQAFVKMGKDFVVADNLESLVASMNKLAKERDGPTLDYDAVLHLIELRDLQIDNRYTKDAQIMQIKNSRQSFADRRRVANLHRLLDSRYGPLIAVRMNILTRKSLGGLETNLDSNVLRQDGTLFPGLYAAGEAAGFGGGGVHGYSALEGTFLGGCIFSGRAAGLALAKELRGEVRASF